MSALCVVASTLTRSFVVFLSAFEFRPANRNAVDPSGLTDTGLRPDYWLLVRGALLLKAEHKRVAAELAVAKAELVSKMKGWNSVFR